MKRRLMIARTAHEPRLLILDEPQWRDIEIAARWEIPATSPTPAPPSS
jgi:ABC-type multidrug transport system ATPase subunit